VFPDEQVPSSKCKVYVPAVETVILCVVAPFDQTLKFGEEEVKVTLPPLQKLTVPEGVIVGVAKFPIVTFTVFELTDGQPGTEYVTK